MNNSSVCPQCGRESINGMFLCNCERWANDRPLPPWNLPVKHEPSQDDKLDKIIALLEQIKERL